jgi:putative salt-induced outer membrane protein
MFVRSVCAAALCACAGTALAQVAPATPGDPFVGNVALGYLATSGNTDSTNFNAALKVTWDLDGPWMHEWNALAISARTDDETTAEAQAAGYKAQRSFGEKSYIFFAGDWRQDRFSGYDRQVTEAIGYGNRLIETERHMLSLEAGAGAKQSDLITGEELDEAIVRGALDYAMRISDTSEFSQKLLIEQGEDNRYTESTTALKTRIVGNLAVVLSYVIKNNSDVPVGIEKTDRFTAVSLEYGF